MAIRRGKDNAGVLKVQLSVPEPDIQRMTDSLHKAFHCEPCIRNGNHHHSQGLRRETVMTAAIADAVKRLVIPAITRAAWRDALHKAENGAVDVFAANLKSLLLTPPLRSFISSAHNRPNISSSSSAKNRDTVLSSNSNNEELVICGIDPGLRQGHKVIFTISCRLHNAVNGIQ